MGIPMIEGLGRYHPKFIRKSTASITIVTTSLVDDLVCYFTIYYTILHQSLEPKKMYGRKGGMTFLQEGKCPREHFTPTILRNCENSGGCCPSPPRMLGCTPDGGVFIIYQTTMMVEEMMVVIIVVTAFIIVVVVVTTFHHDDAIRFF